MKEGEEDDDERSEGAQGDDSGGEPVRIATGLPIALQAARRIARATRVLPLDELESLARCAFAELLSEYNPDRGNWRSFVATRVGFALCRALRKERRAKTIEAEIAVRAGLAHIEAMEPCVDPHAGNDEDAYVRLNEVTSEAADVLALHLSLESEETRTLVRQVLSELADFDRRVVQEHLFNGTSFRRLAVELGATLGKVRRAYERALPRLRRRLRRVG